MSYMKGFAAAQAAYDNMQHPDYYEGEYDDEPDQDGEPEEDDGDLGDCLYEQEKDRRLEL